MIKVSASVSSQQNFEVCVRIILLFQQEYTSKHLTGLKVQHKAENFKEGQSVILTLADKGILDEDGEGDTLTNINIQELEKAEKNLEVKRKGPGYKAYEDDEVDEFGMVSRKQR